MGNLAYHAFMLFTGCCLVWWLFKPELRKVLQPHLCPRCRVRMRAMNGAPCHVCIQRDLS